MSAGSGAISTSVSEHQSVDRSNRVTGPDHPTASLQNTRFEALRRSSSPRTPTPLREGREATARRGVMDAHDFEELIAGGARSAGRTEPFEKCAQ